MRVAASTSSSLSSPTSGLSTTPAYWPWRGELLDAVHERVLVGAVERVAGLEGERRLPAVRRDHRARLERRHDEVAIGGVLRRGQRADRAADQLGAGVTDGDVRARVVECARCRRPSRRSAALSQSKIEATSIRPTTVPSGSTSAAVCPSLSFAASASVTGRDERDRPGVAARRSSSTHFSSSTRSYCSRVMNPSSGDSVPSAMRYTVARSAFDTAIFGIPAASASSDLRWLSLIERLTGASRPPCTGTRAKGPPSRGSQG